MKLHFLGTRAYIEASSPAHRRHASLLVSYEGSRVLLDCGEDWADAWAQSRKGELARLRPQGVLLTHCHPDHAWGLKGGAPCPVWATADSWQAMDRTVRQAVAEPRVVVEEEPLRIGKLEFTAFGVVHSTRCPAVGYRIAAGQVDKVRVFYVPDVVAIRRRAEALAGVRLYVGDGSSLERSLVRKVKGGDDLPDDGLVGHTPARTQLGWCARSGVPRAVFTHLGSKVLRDGDEASSRILARLGQERGVRAELARDGMDLVLRAAPREPTVPATHAS